MNTKCIPDHILELALAKEDKSITPQESIEFEQWILANPNCESELHLYVNIYKKTLYIAKAKQINKIKAWRKISKATAPKTLAFYTKRMLQYAAVLIPLLGIGVLIYQYQNTKDKANLAISERVEEFQHSTPTLILSTGKAINLQESTNNLIREEDGTLITKLEGNQLEYNSQSKNSHLLNTLIIPRGEHYQLKLADGTKVWVNSDTQFKYPSSFGEGERRVELIGEAYFEVTTDAARPFVVVTSQLEVTVKGTSFNVSAYQKDEVISATLIEGMVEVKSERASKVILQPGQKACTSNKINSIIVENINTKRAVSWIEGIYYFDNMPLSELVLRVERWYDIDITLNDNTLGGLMFTGAMERDKPVELILNLIKESKSINYKINGKQVTLFTE